MDEISYRAQMGLVRDIPGFLRTVSLSELLKFAVANGHAKDADLLRALMDAIRAMPDYHSHKMTWQKK